MKKEKKPDHGFLVLELRGFSRWSETAGYAESLAATEKALQGVETAVEGAGGRILDFQEDRITVAFLRQSYAGAPAAIHGAREAMECLQDVFQKVRGVRPMALIHADAVPKGRLRADLSNLKSLAADSIRTAERLLGKLKTSSSIHVTDAVISIPGLKLDVRKAPGVEGAHVLKRATGFKGTAKKLPRPAEKETLSKGRLEGLLRKEPVPFSVLAFRTRKSRSKAEGESEIPKDLFSRIKGVLTSFGGEIVKEPKNALIAQFRDIHSGAEAAFRALRAGALALDEMGRRLGAKGLYGVLGSAVVSDTAPYGELLKQGGAVLRHVSSRARQAAAPREGRGISLDEETERRVGGRFSVVEDDSGRKDAKYEAEDFHPGPTLVRGCRLPRSQALIGLGPYVRKIRDALRRADRNGSCLSVSLTSAEESFRHMGTAGLAELGRDLGWRVLEVRSAPSSRLRPLGPFRDLIGQIAGLDTQDAPGDLHLRLASVLENYTGESEGFMLMGLKDLFKSVGQSSFPESAVPSLKRCQIEKGILLLLAGYALEAPTLFLFREFHLADPASVAMAGRLVTFLGKTTSAFAFVEASPPPGRKAGLEIALKPLSLEKSYSLAREILGTRDLPGELKRLLGKLGGDPFRIDEALRFLVIRGNLRRDRGKWTLAGKGIPKDLGLLNLAGLRMKSLPNPLKKAMGAAAVLGVRFERGVFAGLHPESPLKALLALEAEGWIRPFRSRGSGQWTFVHESIREAAGRLVTKKERAELHGRAGEVLKHVFGAHEADVDSRVALHRLQGGQKERYFETLLEHGRTIKSLGFPDEAEEAFRRALKLPALNDFTKATLLFERAEALSALGRASEALSDLESALRAKSLRVPKKKSRSPSI